MMTAWPARLGDGLTRWVLLLGLLGALPLVLLTPPFQVADEPQHFQRAYQISRLDLFGHPGGRGAGAVLPASLSEMVRDELGTTALEAERPIVARPLATGLKGLSRPLDPDRTRFTDFTGAAPYSPLPYLPQAAAVATGRALGLGPLALLYAARLANALAAILLLTLAVRVAPLAREAVALAGLLPMALYQYASASPDAMTIATLLLFTALALRALVQGWTRRGVVLAATLGAVFCSHKLVYAPVLLLALVPPVLRSGERLRAITVNGLIVLIAAGGAIGWLALNRDLPLTRLPGTDMSAQLALVADHPRVFAAALRGDLDDYMLWYFVQMVGVIGWMLGPLPPAIYWVAPVAMILTVFVHRPDEPGLPRIAGLWQVLLVVAGCVLIELALYLTWSPVGGTVIRGVQGRYFLPLLAAFLAGMRTMLCLPADADRSRLCSAIVLALIAAQVLVLDATIISAYSRFG